MKTPSNSPERRRAAARLAVAMTIALAGADGPGSGGPPDPPFTALKVDGTTVVGRLRQLDPRGGVALAVDDEEKLEQVPADSLVKLTREVPAAPGPGDRMVVLFPDGDRLYPREIGPAGEAALEVQSPALGGTLAVPIDGILGLILSPPKDDEGASALANTIREEPRSTEVLWLANGDRVAGGLLGIDDKTIAFRAASGKVEADRSGVLALGFDPKLVAYPKPDGPYLELTLLDGSRLGLVASRVEGGQLVATTRLGIPIKLPLGEVAQVHAKNGRVAYLSDREPTLAKYVGYVGPVRPSRRDLAVDGQPLKLGGKAYDRGLGTQSRTYLVYRLEPGVTRLQGLVGLDDRAGPLGSVVFRVVVNGEDRYVSPPMSARDLPRALDVDLKGAKTLVLVTEFGERGDIRDLADWVEIRLIR